MPEDVRARGLLAIYYAATGRKKDAVGELQKAVDLRPHDSNILYNAACTYRVMARKPEAIEMLRRAKVAGSRKRRLDPPRPRPRLPPRRARVREALRAVVRGLRGQLLNRARPGRARLKT
ncbi:MAG TPA: hypothetical protein VLL75_02975 [Vicinamibacteria bacterium]|nr:hypothetical protein [Vicinamibacteria bacterium]